MSKRSSPAGSDRGGLGASERRVQSRSTPSEAKSGSLVGRHRVLLPHPGSAIGHLIAPGDHHTLQHIQVHFGVDFQADFENVRWHDVALTWNHTKSHNRSRKLCFHHPGHVPVIRGNPDLHFEGAGNGSVVITWTSRGMSWTAAHLRSRSLNIVSLSDMIEGSNRTWDLYTTGQLVDGLQQKKENQFSLNGNGIMSFLRRQFYVPPCTVVHQVNPYTTKSPPKKFYQYFLFIFKDFFFIYFFESLFLSFFLLLFVYFFLIFVFF